MIELIKGDTLPFKTSLKDAEGNAIERENISTIYCTVKKNPSSLPIFQKTLEDMEYEDGILHVVFESSDTNKLSVGDYIFDLEITLTSGYRKTRTFELRILDEVTTHE